MAPKNAKRPGVRSWRQAGVGLLALLVVVAVGAGCGERRGTAAPEENAAAQPVAAGGGEGMDTGVTTAGVENEEVPVFPAGIDAAGLRTDARVVLAEILREQFDPCGKPRSFHDALAAADGCDMARHLATAAVERLKDGWNKKQVVAHLLEALTKRARRVDFDLEGVPCSGEAQPGQRVIVEFSDFECPHCAAVFGPAKALAARHGARLCAKQLPLPGHAHAREAALAALAAHRQGQYWVYAEALHARFAALSEEAFVAIARELKLDLQRFDADRRGTEVAEALARDLVEAELARIDGTPTFFVDGELVPFEDLETALTAPRVE
jgi:hypothetical protein